MNKINEKYFPVKNGELYIEGIRAAELAGSFGTPLFVYSKSFMRDRIAEIRDEFLDRYDGTFAAYAGKAFLVTEMCRLADEEGLCLDVVSPGEFFTAKRAGFPAERIVYHGNNKTYEELDNIIQAGVGRLIIDGLDELDMVDEIVSKHGLVQTVCFRITPEVKVDTHDHITTGQRDSKFGIPTDDHILYPLIKRVIDNPNIMLQGLHFHIGSQLFDAVPYVKATEKVLEVVKEIKDRFDFTVPEIIIGGGYGIRYTDKDERKPYSHFLDPVMDCVKKFCETYDFPQIHVGIEPGRSIVGEAGVTLYTIGTVKQIPDGKKFVSIDGGMSDNIRPALYGAEYEAVIANKAEEPRSDVVTICGRLCESGDRILEDAKIAHAARGDILCVFSTGAYGYSMANNYNKIQKPAVVFVEGNDAKLVVRRQSLEEMTSSEI